MYVFMLSTMCVLASWSDGAFVQARGQHEQAGHCLERTMCVFLCKHASMHVCMCVRKFHFARRWGKTESARTRKLQDPATAQSKKHSIVIVRDWMMPK